MQTTSSIKDWRTCRRLYRYRHVDLVRPRRKKKALSVGSAFHDGTEAFDAGVDVDLFDDEYWCEDEGRVEAARVRALLRAYRTRWADFQDDWQIIALEEEFRVRLGSRELGGKWDAIKRYKPSGELYVWERKTTSDEIATVGNDYWRRLALDTQLAIYTHAARQIFDEDVAVIYDVVRKPAGNPLTAIKRDEHGNPTGKPTQIKKRKAETEEEFEARKEAARETLEEYEERLVSTMLVAPDEWLVRHKVHRTREQQELALADVQETLTDIESYRGRYPLNDAACRSKFGTRPYLDVCAGYESLDTNRFERLKTSHPELTNHHPGGNEDDQYADCPL